MSNSHRDEGSTHLCFDFRIDMKEMATWSAERIKQFFGGIAKMLAAAKEDSKP